MAAKKTVAVKKKPVAVTSTTTAKAPSRPTTLQSEVSTLQTEVKKLQTAATKHHPASKTKHKAAKSGTKHGGTAKHATGTKRGLAAAPDGVACCAAQAVAASLRLAGGSVSTDDILELFWLTPGADETGAAISDTLAAAQVHGLAGAYPVFRPAAALADGVIAGITLPRGTHTVTLDRGGVWTWDEWHPLSRPLAIEEAWVLTWQ